MLYVLAGIEALTLIALVILVDRLLSALVVREVAHDEKVSELCHRIEAPGTTGPGTSLPPVDRRKGAMTEQEEIAAAVAEADRLIEMA